MMSDSKQSERIDNSDPDARSNDRMIPANTAGIIVHVKLIPNSDGKGQENNAGEKLEQDNPKEQSNTSAQKVTSIDHVFFQLRRRGFVVESCASDDIYVNQTSDAPEPASASVKKPSKPKPVNYWVLVTFSPKLLVRLAVIKTFPITRFGKYSPLQKLQLIQSGIELILKSKSELFIIDAWVAHDPKRLHVLFNKVDNETTDHDNISTPDNVRLKYMLNKSTKKINILIGTQLEAVYEYYGPQIGIYFGFLNYYTNALIIPSVAGTVVFIHQYFTNAIDTEYVPFFVIMLSIWSTWFVQSWKSKCSEYCYNWDTFGIEELELDKELAKAASKEHNTRTMRLLFSFMSTMILIYFMLRVMLYFIDANMRVEELYGDSYMKYYPQIMYSLFPIISPYIFEPIANILNNLEQHPTRYEEENYMIMKKFALQFVNRYSALLYVAFYKQDLEMLRSLLISLLTTGAIINNATELGIPFLTSFCQRMIKKWLIKKQSDTGQVGDSAGGSKRAARNSIVSVAQMIMLQKRVSRKGSMEPSLKASKSLIEEKDAEKIVDKERYYSPYDINDDYLEMVIQYGYVIMFAVAFPITPLLAFVNNYFEFHVDLMKLSSMRRPPLILRSSIGAWQTCLEILSFIAILTNCYLLTMVSSKISVLVPSSFHDHLNSVHGKLLAMIALEHLLFGFNVAFTHFIEQVPRFIREGVARKRVKQLDQEKKKVIRRLQEDGIVMETGDLNKKSGAEKDSDKDLYSGNKSDSILSMYSATNSPYLFGISNPVQMTALFSTPLLLNWFRVSPLLFIPASFFYFAYLQTEKERIERQLAINIVANQSTLGAFLQDSMPSFIRDHDVQRVEWLNMILQRVWPYFSLALEKLLVPILQPILTANTPFFLSSLEIKKLSTGSIAPKITGVRVFSTDQQKVTLDIELKWVADLHVSLKVGTHPMPTLVELTELSLSGTVRVELLDLIPQLPLFKAYTVTCMKKPEVKFSLKIANMVDIMSIGVHPAFSVTALVQSIINSALTDLLIYPKKLVFPLGDATNFDESAYANVTPIGHLEIYVEKAVDLKAANLFGDSDPYIEIFSSMDQKFRTKTIQNTLNPIYNQSFTITVYDLSSQGVEFKVFDYNEYAQSVFLGECSITMSDLIGEAATVAADLEGDETSIDPAKVIVNTSHIAEVGFEGVQKTFPLKNIEKGAMVALFSYKPVKSAAALAAQSAKEQQKDAIRFADITKDIIYDLPRGDLDDNAFILNDMASMSPDEIVNRARRRKKRNLLKQHRNMMEEKEDTDDALSGYDSAGTFGSEDRNDDDDDMEDLQTRNGFSEKKSSSSALHKTLTKATNALKVTNVLKATSKATSTFVNMTTGRKKEDVGYDGKDLETQSVTSTATSPSKPPLLRSVSSRLPLNLNGTLVVSSIKAFNLHPPANPGAGDSSAGAAKVSVWDFRPFVSISIGKQVFETSYMKNNHNPEFTQSFKFLLGTAANGVSSNNKEKQADSDPTDLSSSIVYFRAMDRCSKYSLTSVVSMSSSASKMLGYVNVPLVDIVQAIRKSNGAALTADASKSSVSSKSTEIVYRLEGEYSESRISCKFSWIPVPAKN